MKKHIYAFGSVCRGELDSFSDIDLLLCVDEATHGHDLNRFSVYTYSRLCELWAQGNPFAWHLHLESKLLHSSDGSDYLNHLGAPHPYGGSAQDCAKFAALFAESLAHLLVSHRNATFNLSTMFLAMRNFATCYSFTRGRPIFSRYSPLILKDAAPVSRDAMDIFVRARVLSTRGLGDSLTFAEVEKAAGEARGIAEWMARLMPEEVAA